MTQNNTTFNIDGKEASDRHVKKKIFLLGDDL